MSAETVLARRPRRRAEINIIPLIDVLVVLIFFFLMSMQFRNLTTLSLDLPEVESAGEEEPVRDLRIAVTPGGEIYFGQESQPISLDELRARLQSIARSESELPVLISADQESFLRFTTTVMDVCRQEGFTRIRLQTK